MTWQDGIPSKDENMMAHPVLKVEHLTTPLQIGDKVYNAVDDLSFDLHLGKTLALVGESGCGKTLAALSIMRILPTPPCLPSTGRVLYKDKDLLSLPNKAMRKIRGANIAMIFQDPTSSLNPVYTIGNQLIEVANLHLGLYGQDALDKTVQSLKEVGIANPQERIYDYPHQLSGGMKQRVMIAMALMCEPDVLIADEPTTALDVTIQKQVLDLIKDLQREKDMALLLITHDMGIVAEMADDVIVMYASQAMEKGDVFQIFDHMAHPYTMGLFKSCPEIETKKEKLYSIKGSVPPLSNYPKGCRFHPRCPFVMEKCKTGEIPDYQTQKEPRHLSKCTLQDGTKESEDRYREVIAHG